jgi:dTDP-glucose 4,6-dehydratase
VDRVLVTGAGGFIGSTLCDLLVRDGHTVRAFVRYTSHDSLGALALSDDDVRASLEVVSGDLRDPLGVAAAVKDCDVVLHLGATISIPYSYRRPREVVESNVLGTLNVLDAARVHETRRVVVTSTSEVYGTALRATIDEEHPLQGQSPYSASKIGADKLAESYWRSFGTPVVTLRPFNTYGPRQSPRAVIPAIIIQALAGGQVRLGSLTPTRDFTYVDDTARAFELAATAPGIEGATIHLGTGREVSIADVVTLVGEILGGPLDVVQEDERIRPAASEVMRLLSDPSHAQAELGWEPTISLEEGLRRTVDWCRDHGAWFSLPGYAV